MKPECVAIASLTYAIALETVALSLVFDTCHHGAPTLKAHGHLIKTQVEPGEPPSFPFQAAI